MIRFGCVCFMSSLFINSCFLILAANLTRKPDERYLHLKAWQARVHDKVPVAVSVPLGDAVKKRGGFLANHQLTGN